MTRIEVPEDETIERLLRELRISLPVIEAMEPDPLDAGDPFDETVDDVSLPDSDGGHRTD